MDQVIVAVNLFAVCLFLALLEVHIEGPHGWAEKLPTWRIDRPWIRKLTNGKPITGYHLYINLVILGFLHYPLVLSNWTLVGELRVLSEYFLVAVWWDFLWFVVNPHFGVRRFKSENVWWHKNWFLGIPKEYPTGTIVSAALWFIAWKLHPAAGTSMLHWLIMLGVIVALTILTATFVELTRKRTPPTQA